MEKFRGAYFALWVSHDLFFLQDIEEKRTSRIHLKSPKTLLANLSTNMTALSKFLKMSVTNQTWKSTSGIDSRRSQPRSLSPTRILVRSTSTFYSLDSQDLVSWEKRKQMLSGGWWELNIDPLLRARFFKLHVFLWSDTSPVASITSFYSASTGRRVA